MKNMRTIAFFMIFLNFAIQSCGVSKHEEASNNKCDQARPCECGISQETAVWIAKGAMSSDYDIAKYESDVTESDGTFVVHLKRKEGADIGTGPILYIQKSDGKRAYTVHSK